jgi:hypothetical protein
VRTLFFAAFFACCAGAISRADAPGDTQEAGRQPIPPVAAPRMSGGVGATTASSPGHTRLNCRRYFGCLPANRSAVGFTQD